MEKYDLQIIIASGHEHLKKAVLGFAIAASAAAMNMRVVIFLSMDGIEWAKDCEWLHKKIPEHKSIKEYIDSFILMGGRLEVCTSCLPNPQSLGASPLSSPCIEEYHLAGLTEVVLRTQCTQTLVF